MTSKARNSRGTTDEVTPSYRVIEAETVPLVVRLISGLGACGGNGATESFARRDPFGSHHVICRTVRLVAKQNGHRDEPRRYTAQGASRNESKSDD